MAKKISLTIILIMGLVILAGCSGTETTTEAPESDSTKKVTPAGQTRVPKGMSAEDYLKKYYDFYVSGKYSESYKLLPAGKKESQTVEDYTAAHKSLGVTSYEMGTKKEDGDTTTVDVKVKTKDYGIWTSSWIFEKDSKGLIASDYSASGSSGGSSGSSGGGAPH